MVVIVAVLVVTVASQARNTKQQQTEDETLLSSFGIDQRHPRFISRTVTNQNNNTSENLNETSVILKTLKALVMRVVTPTFNQTVSNASGQVFQEIVTNVDNQPSYAGESKVIVRRK